MIKAEIGTHHTTDAQKRAIENLSRGLGIAAIYPKQKAKAQELISRLIAKMEKQVAAPRPSYGARYAGWMSREEDADWWGCQDFGYK